MGRTAEELTADIHRALERTTAAFEALISAGSPALANDAAWLLERRAEELTLLARSLPIWTSDPDRGHSAQPPDLSPFSVQIRQTAEGWLHLTLPALLPKKNSGRGDLVYAAVAAAMRKWCSGRKPLRFTDCVLVFRHVYDRMRPMRRMRDHDNIECKSVTDVLALYAMPDDGPAVCSRYECSVAGDADRTEVYLIPRAAFPTWLEQEKALSEGREKNGFS